MKLTNAMIVNSVEVLGKLSNTNLPVKVSYTISKNLKEIQKELDIYNEEKQKLINKYGEKDEDSKLKVNEDGQINISDIENWNKDIDELNSIELKTKIVLIKIDDLSQDIRLTPNEFSLIEYMFM